MESQQSTTSGGFNKWILIVIIGAMALLGFKYLGKNNKEVTEPIENNTPAAINQIRNREETSSAEGLYPTPAAINQDGYKDGTYSAEGLYVTPAGSEIVNVTITLKDDKVTNAEFKGNAVNPISIKWQGEFSKGFKEVVVGKNIDEVSLTVVNGSSLTPKGFMNALEKIKIEATV